MKTTKSLSFFITIWMAFAIAASRAAYAVYERQTLPGVTLNELAVHHLGHVLGLGAMIYILCWSVFYFVLLRPLNHINLTVTDRSRRIQNSGTGFERPGNPRDRGWHQLDAVAHEATSVMRKRTKNESHS